MVALAAPACAADDLTCPGDNIVSQWGFHFEEPRRSLPQDLIDAYPQMIDEWVFGHFGNLLDEEVANSTAMPL
ncbi:hypothetical protein PUR25_02095 [Streptomyces sp. JV181]|uniref:hypothetical protein n=1 Tax=Streptomyces sp. JV181 TaxID=858635 RepID=UPI002E78DCAF|nr:hypothetical protein [Streptomyces sp. JV181]MEE1774880.1 hypothetical protein [Streptomyces sp. JV181]